MPGTVIELLDQLRTTQEPHSPEPVDPPIEADHILSMSATEFKDSNLAILIRSYLLGEDIVLASNERSRVLYGDQYVTYLPEELMAAYQLSPDFIKKIHRIKKLWDGDILNKGVV